VFGGNGFRGTEIGDGAGDLENPVVRAGAEAHASDRHFESAFAGFVEGAQFAQLARGDAGVVETAPLLDGARALHTVAHFRGANAGVFAAQFFIRN
jgi:hypothetical protein